RRQAAAGRDGLARRHAGGAGGARRALVDSRRGGVRRRHSPGPHRQGGQEAGPRPLRGSQAGVDPRGFRMTETRPTKPNRSPAEVVLLARRHMARTALVLAIVGVLMLGFAAFGLREAMFDLDYAVTTLALSRAPAFAIGALIVGGLAFLAAVLVRPRRDRIGSLLAVAMGAGVMAVTAH